jgi:hypothetical protein
MRGLVPALMILASALAVLPPFAAQENPFPHEVDVTATVTPHAAPIVPITGVAHAAAHLVVECVPPYLSLMPLEVKVHVMADKPYAVVTSGISAFFVDFAPEECAVLPVSRTQEIPITITVDSRAPAGDSVTFRVFAQVDDGPQQELVSWQETVGHYLNAGARLDQLVHRGQSPFDIHLTFTNHGNSPLLAHVSVVDPAGAEIRPPGPTEVAPKLAGGGEANALLHVSMDALGKYAIEIAVELVPTVVEPPGESAQVALHFRVENQLAVIGEAASASAVLAVALAAMALALSRRT